MRGSSITLPLVVVLSCAYQPPKFAVTHTEQRGRIDGNGLRFVIMPDRGATVAEVAVRYDVGSSDDPVGKAGLAHLVEHLMFQIRPDAPTAKPLRYYIERLATKWNAYTTYDETHYYTVAAPRQLETVLQLEAIRLHDGCTSISEDEFAREREVVRNEIRQRTGTPEGQIEPLLLASLVQRISRPESLATTRGASRICRLSCKDIICAVCDASAYSSPCA